MVFNSFILILTVRLFQSANCLDINGPSYAQNEPFTGYIQPSLYQHPRQSGMYYQSSALNEAYHHDLDYHRGQSQQNYGQIARRSLPPLTQVRQVPCPHKQVQQSPYRCYRSIPITNYPQYPHCKAHDYPKDNYNNDEELIPQQERNSRSASESSTLQSDSLNLRSPVYIPKYSTNESNNQTMSKRSVYRPPITSYIPPNRRNYTSDNMSQMIPATTNIPVPIETSSNFSQTLIVNPSRKLVILNNTSSDQSLGRSSFPRDYNTFINYPRNQFNSNTRSFDKFNNGKMFMDNSRSSGSSGAGVQDRNNFPGYQSYIEPQKSFRNSPITSDSKFVNFKQPILSYEPRRYGRTNNARSADYFPALSSVSLSSNDEENVNHKLNMEENNSEKSLLSESSRKVN
ncbi:hypothetical protein PV328_001746 [Microctonus aethiopoides]|uniref:Uncharacterized protein n=1 Tax=Microctonus aethiopoides TaxID=144406 RepID=A0AA39FY28_9HYME|nr:hypothetical protein PV328_001746 [Microctonus aethiopoides]